MGPPEIRSDPEQQVHRYAQLDHLAPRKASRWAAIICASLNPVATLHDTANQFLSKIRTFDAFRLTARPVTMGFETNSRDGYPSRSVGHNSASATVETPSVGIAKPVRRKNVVPASSPRFTSG